WMKSSASTVPSSSTRLIMPLLSVAEAAPFQLPMNQTFWSGSNRTDSGPSSPVMTFGSACCAPRRVTEPSSSGGAAVLIGNGAAAADVSAPATTNTAPHDSARGARLPPNSAPSLLVARGILRMPTPVRDMDACVASGVPRRGQPHQRTRLALVGPCDEGNPRRLPAYRTSRYSWRTTPVPQTGPLLLSCVLLPPRNTAQSVSGRIQA